MPNTMNMSTTQSTPLLCHDGLTYGLALPTETIDILNDMFEETKIAAPNEVLEFTTFMGDLLRLVTLQYKEAVHSGAEPLLPTYPQAPHLQQCTVLDLSTHQPIPPVANSALPLSVNSAPPEVVTPILQPAEANPTVPEPTAKGQRPRAKKKTKDKGQTPTVNNQPHSTLPLFHPQQVRIPTRCRSQGASQKQPRDVLPESCSYEYSSYKLSIHGSSTEPW